VSAPNEIFSALHTPTYSFAQKKFRPFFGHTVWEKDGVGDFWKDGGGWRGRGYLRKYQGGVCGF
jgi:hypothetical protein